MKSGCPDKSEWLSLLDGEATENRATLLRAHADTCPDCANELALQRRLLADLSTPVQVMPGAVEAIMRRLPESPATTRPHRLAWTMLGGAVALAVAASVLVIPRLVRDPGTFTARGGDKVAWNQKVDTEIFMLGPPLAKVETGAILTPGVALVASYNNVGKDPVFLMIVGRDVEGEWHWIYPGFVDPKSDPLSVRLEPMRVRRALPETAVLDDVAPGALELVTLITREPIRVSRLEKLARTERSVDSLRARFGDARVTSLAVRVVAAAPDAGDLP